MNQLRSKAIQWKEPKRESNEEKVVKAASSSRRYYSAERAGKREFEFP